MPTATLRPNGDLANSGPNTFVGGASATAVLSDNNDASYVNPVLGGYVRVAFSDVALPGGAVVRTVTPRLRAGVGGASPASVQVSTIFDGTEYPSDTQSTASIQTLSFSPFTGAYSNATINGLGMTIWVGSDIGGPYHGHRAYEAYIDVLYANPPNAPTVSGPSGSVTTTAQPTVSWTHNAGTDGSGQVYYRVRVFSAAQYGAGGFDPSASPAVWDSGDVLSGAASASTGVLPNGGTYKAYVYTIGQVNGANQWSPWAAGPVFTINITVAAPTGLVPVAGSTVTSSQPSMDATVAATIGNPLVYRQFQFSQSSTFASGVISINEPTVGTTRAGAVAWANPSGGTRLAEGTWYVRARTVEYNTGVVSAFTAANSFTVAHAPTTTARSPGLGGTIAYATSVTVNWTFSDIDTTDTQSRFQAQLWKVSDPAGSLKDSGIVASAAGSYTFTGLDATWKDTELRWKVNVADSDLVFGGYSADTSFWMSDPPTVVVTVPAAGGVISTASPTTTWTYAASRGRTQAQWKMEIWQGASMVATSGWVASTASSWTVPSPVVTVGPTFQARLSVIDSVGLQTNVTNNFTATYTAPPTPTFSFDTTEYASAGRVTLDWSGTSPTGSFVAWRVYRRTFGDSLWTLLLETTTPTARAYRDYLAPSQVDTEYAVVQVALSLGVPTESTYVGQHALLIAAQYMLVCPSNDLLNLVLYETNSDNFSSEQEMAAINLPGRGRRVEYGTRYGQTGQLSVTFRNRNNISARAQRLALEALRNSGLAVYLRNPFGDVWKVALNTAAVTRVAGVGLVETATAQIDYSEITA